MITEEKIKSILKLLDEYYPVEIKCYLDYETPWQLLIATILSAQCTDDRVNIVTKDLFEKYTSIEAFANADIVQLENDVRTTGFYHNKARNIILACRRLLDVHNGEMPSGLDELTQLPGVGRKTANVVRSHIFNIPSIVVDTHVKRISGKLGLTVNTDPDKIEADLMKILPEDNWIRFNPQVIAHGRKICKARRPECGICPCNGYCEWYAAQG